MTQPNIDVAEYERVGATVLRGVVDDRWLARLADGVEYNRTHPSTWAHWYTKHNEAVGFWSDYGTWPQVQAYREVALESGLAEIAGELMVDGAFNVNSTRVEAWKAMLGSTRGSGFGNGDKVPFPRVLNPPGGTRSAPRLDSARPESTLWSGQVARRAS